MALSSWQQMHTAKCLPRGATRDAAWAGTSAPHDDPPDEPPIDDDDNDAASSGAVFNGSISTCCAARRKLSPAPPPLEIVWPQRRQREEVGTPPWAW
jgi:hypothetical protein